MAQSTPMHMVRILQVQCARNRKTDESLQWEVLPPIYQLLSLGVSESYYRFELYSLNFTLKYLYYIALKAVGA